jgi:uncharacterized protein with FMN-binding domain
MSLDDIKPNLRKTIVQLIQEVPIMMARIGNKLIAICSAAIGIIYTAGYVVTDASGTTSVRNEIAITQPQQNDSVLTPPSPSPTITSEPSQNTPLPSIQPYSNEATVPQATTAPKATTNTAVPTPITKATPSPTIKSTPRKVVPTSTPIPIVQNQKYHDGTFTGSGTNRFGTVEVAVTIKKGKIAAVDITSSRTRYPQRYINPLPQEVLDAQDDNIDTISGATRSSEDFIEAVHQALLLAEQS